ncbi:MAG: anaerobic ribonucleoside-triphosphate reductase activating protein [Oscillospiraceae bacterium]|nr:anaerobic ribonucleoside-triphosphate reductase activating protein [Oscillospiraceae bacterium]
MNIAEIKKCDVANGLGVRVSLFVSGCTHHCKNCFNPETWDFQYGTPYTEETEQQILSYLNHDYITGLTLLGGEPFEPCNQRVLVGLLKKVRALYPRLDIWCFSGYTFEELTGESRARCEVTDEMLRMIHVLVDGEFVEELKSIRLRFRGSANQRILNVKASLSRGQAVLMEHIPDRV